MADIHVSPQKQVQLRARMAALGIRESDLREAFTLGSGKGGQKVNKTSSCVQLSHAASSTVIKCQRSRSRAMNRFLARRDLCERLEEKIEGEKSARRQRMEKIRRQKRRRSRRAKAKMLDNKRAHGQVKRLRGRVSSSGADA